MVVDTSTKGVLSVVLASSITASVSCQHDRLEPLLERASACLNLKPAAMDLHCQELAYPAGPRLLKHSIPKHRVQLLALSPFAIDKEAANRSDIYTAAILQHAALLLLLLVSDRLLLLIPAAAVPASLLQLLHVVTRVKHLLVQQLQALQRQQKEKLQRRAEAADAPVAHQFDDLLQLLQQEQPTQLHITLQVPSADPAAQAAAVQQAEHTLLKTKAATAAAVEQGGRGRPSSSSRGSGLLFELAGVHCCAAESSNVQLSRKAILNAINTQLAKATQPRTQQQQQQRPASGAQKDQQQQQQQQQSGAASLLPTPSQVVTSVAAVAAGAAGSGEATSAAERALRTTGPISDKQLLLLWQQLLQLLFPAACSSSGSSSDHLQPYPLHAHALLDLDSVLGDMTTAGIDINDSSEDDGSWDESDGGWQEVAHSHDDAAAAEEDGEAPGDVLAAAVDPLYQLSAKRCMAAARAALARYLQVVPQRYSQATHDAATADALALYCAAASGPAQPEVQRQLVACCLAAWRSGRQQCAALSLTGRQCALSPHDASVHHDSGTLLHIAAPDGSHTTDQQDWFDLEQANVAPAAMLLLQQQQQQLERHQQDRQQAGTKQLAKVLSVVAKLQLGHAVGQQQEEQQHLASISGSSKSPLSLGRWFSVWGLGSGNVAYNSATGLSGPGWLPGFNKLLQLRVLAPRGEEDASEAAATAAACAVAASAAAGGGGRDASPKGAGGRGRAAAAAAGAKGSWAHGRPQKGAKGQRGNAAAAAAPAAAALGPEDFPTLAEALLGSKKATPAAAAAPSKVPQQRIAVPQVKQEPAKVEQESGPGTSMAGDKDQPGQHSRQEAPADLQQQLVDAWVQLDQHAAVTSTAAGSGSSSNVRPGASAAAAAAAAAQQHERGQLGAKGGPRGGRGRSGAHGQKGAAAAVAAAAAAAAAVGGSDLASDQKAVLAALWIGLEYESLSGSRAILHPVQLLKSLQLEQQQRVAATAAASSAVRNLPTAEQQQQQHKRGGSRAGRQQHEQVQQQQQQQALAADQVLGVEQLLLQDVPLFLPAAAATAAAKAADGAAGNAAWSAAPAAANTTTAVPAPTAAGAELGGGSIQPLDPQLLQLQRIFIRTPPAPFALASQPRISFAAAAASSAAVGGAAPAAEQAPAADATAAVGGGVAGGAQVEFSISSEVLLPADSLMVMHLPKVYAAPSSWVRLLNPAAAAGAAAGAVPASGSNSKFSGARGEAAAGTMEVAGAAGQADHEGSDTPAATAAAADGAFSLSTVDQNSSEVDGLLPLMPMKLLGGAGDAGSSAAVYSWNAFLKAGSWLYPVSSLLQAERQQQ